MSDRNLERRWVREEVVILVVEYFRTKDLSIEEIAKSHEKISDFLRRREEILTGQPVSDIFRNYAGIHMQSGRIRCLDPDTKYQGMQGTKLQKEIVQEYLINPKALILEAEKIYKKYGEDNPDNIVNVSENEWTQMIARRMKPFLSSNSLNVDTLRKIPYSQEIIGYSETWEPEYMKPDRFETDLVIYEEKNSAITPRIIVESKYGGITTHDAITYSYKAEKHKNITPYLRYGIMIGNRANYPLPGRLFRHGTNFDFMISFTGADPSDLEWDTFKEMIIKEVEYSRVIEEMLHESRNKDRKKYYMLQKQLVLKESNSLT